MNGGITRHVSIQPMPRVVRPFERVHIDIAGGGDTLGRANASAADKVISIFFFFFIHR